MCVSEFQVKKYFFSRDLVDFGQNFLCNFGREHYGKQSCKLKKKMRPELQDEMSFKEKV